jgi:signal transduction histidine kinase/ActR/RegA family two-component response regulator
VDDARRLETLEAELAAARRTIDALVSRTGIDDLDRFAVYKTIAHLESIVEKQGRQLDALHQLEKALYEGGPDAILQLDRETRIIGCNPLAERILRRAQSELVGVPVSAVLEPASGAALTGLLWAGFSGVGESPITLEDGRKVSFAVGQPSDTTRFVTFRDDTARLLLEEELHHARRLASIGHLAGGVAHQINNPLAVIQGRVELLQSLTELDVASLARQLQVIMDHCRRIAGIVENLQTFARPRPAEPRFVSVRDAIARALQQVQTRVPRPQIQSSVTPPDLEIRADPSQLAQLIANLVATLADHGPRRAFRIEASGDSERGAIWFAFDAPAVPPEVLEELQSSYPPVGRTLDPGTSLALSISWALIREHGGRVETAPGEPPRVRLVLPADSSGLGPAGRVVEGERSLKILVVDDEQLLCETVTWMLAEEGHRIVALHAAEDALARLQVEQFDIVLTDLRLPGMDGEALIRTMAERWPELATRAILTSGLLHTPRSDTPYLQKPFSRSQLVAAIRQVADRAVAKHSAAEQGKRA